MIRRTRSSSGSPAWRAQRPQLGRRAARTARAPRGSTAASPGSSSASQSEATSVGSAPGDGCARAGSAIASGRSGVGVAGQRRAARRPSSARSRGPIAQRGPVSRVSSAALAVRSCSRVRVATHLGHLGQPQQSLEADDLDRDLGGGQARRRRRRHGRCRGPARRSRASSAPASRRGSRPPARPARPARRHTSRARPRGPRPRPPPRAGSSGTDLRELRRRAARPARLATSRIRRSERRLTVSGYVGTSARRRPREVIAEAEDVGDRGPAPAVDRLVGVAHGGHRVPATASARDPRRAGGASGPGRRRCLGTRRGGRPGTSPARGDRHRGARRPAGQPGRSGRRSPSARLAT